MTGNKFLINERVEISEANAEVGIEEKNKAAEVNSCSQCTAQPNLGSLICCLPILICALLTIPSHPPQTEREITSSMAFILLNNSVARIFWLNFILIAELIVRFSL